MTVWFDKDRDKWRYHFQFRGERYTGYCIHPDTAVPAATARAAERIEALIHDRVSKKSPAPVAAGFTFGQAVEYFGKTEGRHLAHWSRVQAAIQELLQFFGPDADITTITEERVTAYTDFCRQQTVKRWSGGPSKADKKKWADTGRKRGVRTVNDYLQLLGRILAVRPARLRMPLPPDIKLLKEPKRIPTPIAHDQAEAILKHAAEHLQRVIIICIHTGMRAKEALSVRSRQFNAEQRIIYLDETTKARKGRAVYVNEVAYQALRRCLEDGDALWKALKVDPAAAALYARQWAIKGRGDVPLVLYRPRGKGALLQPIASIATAWDTARTAAGLKGKVRFHDTRASFCSYLAHLGTSALDIQRLAGHEDIQTTMLYIKGADTNLRGAVDRLASQRPLHLPPAPAHKTRTRAKGAKKKKAVK